MAQRRPAPLASEWEAHKARIEELYYSGSLDDLVREMEHAGFFATPAMYKKKFHDWGWRKNINRELALVAAKKRARREEDGRPASVIRIHGKPVPDSKIDRHVKRLKAGLNEGQQPMSPPENSLAASTVVVSTPVSDSSSPVAAVVVHSPDRQGINSPTSAPLAPLAPLASLAPFHRMPTPTLPSVLQPSTDSARIPESPSGNAIARGSVADHLVAAQAGSIPAANFPVGYMESADDSWLYLHSIEEYSHDIETNNILFGPYTIFRTPTPTRDVGRSGRGLPSPLPLHNLPKTRQPIHQAAQNGHTKVVKLLLRADRTCADLDGEGGETPLFLAAQGGHAEIVDALLNAGANPNAVAQGNLRRPIHQAAQEGHLECLRRLLAAGARADEPDSIGVTALLLAAQHGCIEAVEALLDHHANPNAVEEKNQRRAIHQAAQGGHIDCVRRLLDEGVKADEPDLAGVTPFMLACAGGFVEIARLIKEKVPTTDVNAMVTKTGRRAIHMAAQSGRLLVVKFLIEAGALIDQGEEDGATALWLACQDGHLEVVELLLNSGANVDSPTLNSRRRPIHQAAQGGHLKIVQLLDERGADLHSGEADGASPLWVASQQGHTDLVEYMLARGANPNSYTTRTSRFPLHQAAQNGHAGVAAILIRHGANVNAAEEDGWPPLMVAAQQGNNEIVGLLIANGADINLAERKGSTALWIAAQQGHLSTVKMLLEKGASLSVCSASGRHAIHQAAQNGHLEVVKLLVQHGAEVDCKTVPDADGARLTPLWLASQGGHDAIVEFLLEEGASAVIA